MGYGCKFFGCARLSAAMTDSTTFVLRFNEVQADLDSVEDVVHIYVVDFRSLGEPSINKSIYTFLYIIVHLDVTYDT